MIFSGLCGANSMLLADDKKPAVAAKPAEVKKQQTVLVTNDVKVAPLKVKVVNGFQAAGNTLFGNEIRTELTEKKDALEKEMRTEQQKLMQANNEFVSKSPTMNEAAREKEEKKLAKMERDFKIKAQEYNDELETAMRKRMEDIGIEFEMAVADYGKQAGLDMVIDEVSGRPIYVAEHLKCSEDIITKMDINYNKKHSADSKKVAAAPKSEKAATAKV